ncbi:MAG TPA: hypothetical protein VHL58_08470 [Thermoanaerobaculia bacterium]|nr:hypothetical protein [Thermoanaerobaculia bacterium]
MTVALAILLVSVACASDRAARTQAQLNAPRIQMVKLGQTMDTVREIMKHDPESQDSALVNGSEMITWHFITKYVENDDERAEGVNTSITFDGGKVVGIKQTAWLKNGVFTKK